MATKLKQYTAAFKAQVALAALKGDKTINELASQFGVHPTRLQGCLESAGVAVSMDGKGRCLDNVFVERLGRSVKYEEVYLHRYEAVPQLANGLERYFAYYNEERLHQSLNYRTPAAVYLESRRSA